MSVYQELLGRLDVFTRKYYLNQILRGGLYFLAVATGLFLLFNFLEYQFYFSKTIRKFFLFSFSALSLSLLVYWVLLPFSKYLNLGSQISHEQAAEIIGTHFTTVKDKLLNVLQLKQAMTGQSDVALLEASIDQKIEALRPVPFKQSIDLGKNKKYLKYALPPVLLLLGVLLTSNIIQSSTFRLVNVNQEFEKPALFAFEVQNEQLTVLQSSDYTIKVRATGKVVPSDAFIKIDNYQFKMKPTEAGVFSYTFNNVQKNLAFSFNSNGISSKSYELKTLMRPTIGQMKAKLTYPKYLAKPTVLLENTGDFSLPEGTKVEWVFDTNNTDKLGVIVADKSLKSAATAPSYAYAHRFLNASSYKVFFGNEHVQTADTITYQVDLIKDAYPTIDLTIVEDSLNNELKYCIGEVSDDYGLSRLELILNISSKTGEKKLLKKKVSIDNGKLSTFDYIIDVAALKLTPGDQLEYYFQVFDNDGVNGAKSTKSQYATFSMLTEQELKQTSDQNNETIKKELKSTKEAAQKIQKQLENIKKEVLQKKDLDWQTKKQLEKLLEQQNSLEQQIQNAKDKFMENLSNENKLGLEKKEEILKKQEKIESLFDELMSDELKELMKEMEAMMENMDKDELLNQLEESEVSEQQLEDELDRMLELFKQLEVENEAKKAIDELQELSKKQEELAKDTESGSKSQEELKKEQEEINKAFDDLQKKLDDVKEKNKELAAPMDLGDSEDQEEDIQEQLDKASDQLEQSQPSGASKPQKKAAAKMQEMAASMQSSMQQSEQEQYEEDMQAIRQLLENLVTLSFEQEAVLEQFEEVQESAPRYVSLVQEQYKIKDDFKIVEDSLFALAGRIFEIESFVIEKVGDVNQNLNKGIKKLEARDTDQAAVNQQFAMKGFNDLALMLDEALQQMQMNMAAQSSSEQQCEKCNGKKPGKKKGKKGKPSSMGDMQKQLNDMMKQQMKDGNKGKGMSKKFAEMAAKQAAMRDALRQMKEEMQKSGKGKEAKGLEELMNLMDKTEQDLVNKRINQSTMNRQNEIHTRLLEHDKAQKEREYDDKRQSTSAQEIERKLPPAIEEYLRKRAAEVNSYRTKEPNLTPYYKQLVEEYYKTMKLN